MHSKKDTYLPYKCADNLYNNVSHSNKYLMEIKGDHSSPEISSDQLEKLFIFMDHPIQGYRKSFNIRTMMDEINFVVTNYLLTDPDDSSQNTNNIDNTINFNLVHTE
jgi:hypothetical protein